MKHLNWLLVLVIICLAVIPLAWYDSKSRYEALQAEQATLVKENSSLKAKLEKVQSDLINVQAECDELSAKCEAINQELTETKKVYPLAGVRGFDFKPFAKHPENPILSPGAPGAWDDRSLESPSAVFSGEDGKFWMYFNGVGDDKPFSIGLAYSDDLITWTKEAANPILSVGASGAWDEGHVGDGAVLKIGNTYHMWYGGMDATGTTAGIGHATSTDGKAWVKDTRNPLITVTDEIWPSSILLVDGKYWLYTARETFKIGDVYLYFSDDGIVWTEYEDNPIFKADVPQVAGRTWWLNVVKLDSLWLGAFATRFLDARVRHNAGLTYSLDGKHWVKYPTFVSEISETGWDTEGHAMPHLFPWGDKLYLFYSAKELATRLGRIGLAETKIGQSAEQLYFRNANGIWHDKLLAGGESTYGVPTFGYNSISIYFQSDKDGTLTIEVLEPDGGWRNYDTKAVIADSLAVYPMDVKTSGLRISFDMAATVSAWYELL